MRKSIVSVERILLGKFVEKMEEHGRHVMPCSTIFSMTLYQWRHRSVTTATEKLPNIVLSTLAE